MRNGDIEIDIDGDIVSIIFCPKGQYSSYDLTVGEARVMGLLLLERARRAEDELPAAVYVAALNQSTKGEREIIEATQ